ncbi:hypothetical protein DPMN_194089 [Dreissena polymorpha]|uniref:Uncharacterized protein n=1 Tax=Dreissena polymorpha TaxID=45954 RepID=A0A9D3XZB8_DREPO|nr:hypothetical protein DPMN_194089 [Dreissena polymorpha]
MELMPKRWYQGQEMAPMHDISPHMMRTVNNSQLACKPRSLSMGEIEDNNMKRTKLVLLPLVGVLYVFVVWSLRLFETVPQRSLKEVQSPMIHVNQDCQFVYLDLGSNKGVQIRKLYEPSLYPGAAIIPFFDKLFGHITKSSRRGNVCSFGF